LFGVCSYLPETVNQNVWDATTGSAQTLTATSAGLWLALPGCGRLSLEADLILRGDEPYRPVHADRYVRGIRDHDQRAHAIGGECSPPSVPDQAARQPLPPRGGVRLDVLITRKPRFAGDQAKLG
jgi:hypothetical protein